MVCEVWSANKLKPNLITNRCEIFSTLVHLAAETNVAITFCLGTLYGVRSVVC